MKVRKSLCFMAAMTEVGGKAAANCQPPVTYGVYKMNATKGIN